MTYTQVAPDLVVYWIPYVGIGNDPMIDVVVPLTDVLNYRRADGSPQVSVVILGSAKFTGTPLTFKPPYLDLDGLGSVLTPRNSGIDGPVRQLQAQGIKVLLSVQGVDKMGWDHVLPAENASFAQWVQDEIFDRYGLDGIDIDDEFCKLAPSTQGLVDTVAALRTASPDTLITKALWQDISPYPNYFTQPVSAGSPLAGRYLGQLLDFASSMDYGDDEGGLESFIEAYTTIEVNGQNVGMTPGQLCIGAQAGVGTWMTPLPTAEAVAGWVVQQGYRGMMLYTFSQDIQQWTHQPQNSQGYMFPNPNDHEWQRAIIAAMGVGPEQA